MTTMELKQEICKYCALAYDKGMVVGSGGNISAREGDHIYITPSGYALGDIRPEDLVCVKMDGSWEGTIKPSVETGLHLQCYREREDVQAVIHLHSYFSTLVGMAAKEGETPVMPAYTGAYMVKVGDVGIVPFFKSGSTGLIDAVAALIRKYPAVLMKNHGMIAVSYNLRKTFNLCEDVEINAHMHLDMKGVGALPSMQK